MRWIIVVCVLLLSAGSAAAKANAPNSLDGLAAWLLQGGRPSSHAAAPARLEIDPVLHQALAASVLDGGREAGLHMALPNGRLSLERVIAGRRYRTADDCADCDFVRPIRGHTHPYENPFSVQDLMLTARRDEPMLMVTTAGQVWLAVPTRAVRRTANDWTPIRYALFGNRLECPARPLTDGWAAPSPMGRRVEAVARAAAADLGIVLYVANSGEPLRRLAQPPPSPEVLSASRAVRPDQLNLYETTLLRLMLHQDQAGGRSPFDPGGDMAAYQAAVARVSSTERDPAVVGAMRLAGNLSSGVSAKWFSALPTTVYASPFGDLSASTLSFRSVQMSDDCRSVLVLEGVQDFAPAGVVYSRGWQRAVDAPGGPNEGWRAMTAAEFPTGQVVPW